MTSIAVHSGMTLKGTVDSRGPTACQNHVPGKEMEEKQRGTTSGIGKSGRQSHLLLLPPSSWPAVITGLFLQVHIGVVFALHLSFWAQFEALEAMQGARWLCKAAGWLRALPGRRRSVLTLCCTSTPKDGKGVWWQRWERGLNMGTSLTR